MNMPVSPSDLRIETLAHRIRTGALKAADLVELSLERIERLNPSINAMVVVDHDGARDAAAAADRQIRAGTYLGPLHGIPVAVKDIIDVRGLPTRIGTASYDPAPPAEADAPCVAALRAAGAIILGKTNMDELTVGGHDNPWFGKVAHPLDPSRGVGGSSSGSAAAVATGFCVAALGTDSGGSNRAPAAATGQYGFKPSRSSAPLAGIHPIAPSLDTVGTLAGSIAGLQSTMGAIQESAGTPAPATLRGLRVGLCRNPAGHVIDDQIENALQAWVARLERCGIVIRDMALPELRHVPEVAGTIFRREFAQTHAGLLARQPVALGEAALAFLDESLSITEEAYRRARAQQASLQEQFLARFEEFDLLVIPTSPGLAPALHDNTTSINGERRNYSQLGPTFRAWANLFDVPAVAMPIPTSSDHAASVQLSGTVGSDMALLQYAAAIETQINACNEEAR